MNKQMLRPAIAMIELIFALVIMGIVLLSAPQLISTATKSGYVAIQQEGINEAASQVNMAMGYHWDESTANESFLDPIVQVTVGDADLDESNTSGVFTGHRLGTPQESYRSFIRSDGNRVSASSIGTLDAGETGNHDEDDIDDFNGNTSLVEIEDAGLVDYVEKDVTININTAVRYISDTANYNTATLAFSPDLNTSSGTTTAASATNIKRITATLTSSGPVELEKTII
ncbi:MAG: type II secretion system protein, partial [Gammaproteobacteria bacterium]|nr:type II secretion system protein [Gammaproteobacteria bacterium]